MKRVWSHIWIRLLPKRILTALIGWFAQQPMSRRVIPWYIRHYGIDDRDAELDISEYRTWSEFFSRKLRTEARPVYKHGLCSPVDGRVAAFGEIHQGTLLQAKGREYTVSDLLANGEEAEAYEGGKYCTLYLSPRDYHRVHVPLDCVVTEWRHVPGTLYPVNEAGTSSIAGLFSKNERLIVHLSTQRGRMTMVLVGAAIVGSIRTSFGPSPTSPRKRYKRGVLTERVHVPLHMGDELGYFAFGSTVICLFPPEFPLRFVPCDGEDIRMGQQLAEITSTLLSPVPPRDE